MSRRDDYRFEYSQYITDDHLNDERDFLANPPPRCTLTARERQERIEAVDEELWIRESRSR